MIFVASSLPHPPPTYIPSFDWQDHCKLLLFMLVRLLRSYCQPLELIGRIGHCLYANKLSCFKGSPKTKQNFFLLMAGPLRPNPHPLELNGRWNVGKRFQKSSFFLNDLALYLPPTCFAVSLSGRTFKKQVFFIFN